MPATNDRPRGRTGDLSPAGRRSRIRDALRSPSGRWKVHAIDKLAHPLQEVRRVHLPGPSAERLEEPRNWFESVPRDFTSSSWLRRSARKLVGRLAVDLHHALRCQADDRNSPCRQTTYIAGASDSPPRSRRAGKSGLLLKSTGARHGL